MSASTRSTDLVLAIADAIRQIPRGKVSTYGGVAAAAGYPRNARLVARVLNQVHGLPWQRVLGSGGRISLKGEHAFEQRFLLRAEGVRFKGARVDMAAFAHHFGRAKTRKKVSVVSGSRISRKSSSQPKLRPAPVKQRTANATSSRSKAKGTAESSRKHPIRRK